MESAKLRALSSQCLSIKHQANNIIQQQSVADVALVNLSQDMFFEMRRDQLLTMFSSLQSQADALLVSYNHAKTDAQSFGLQLHDITSKKTSPLLRELIAECDKAIGFVGSPLNPDEVDRLDHIRKESSDVCENLDVHFKKNLELAIQHYERGSFLGSALITSRIIAYIFAQIEGENIEAKISFLEKKNLLEKDRGDVKQSMIKANKKVRDFLSHRIDILADPSDASSLLGDCLKILRIYSKLQESGTSAKAH
ncbi:MAG: hypothetical protein ABSF36_07055 [Candidatus Methanomethylicaceae archaeon]|jgi:hypothetical protein